MHDVLAENDNYRVSVVTDEYPENPRDMGDCFASVLTQLSSRYAQPDSDFDARIVDAWNRTCDSDVIERYARAYLDAVAVGWYDDPRGNSRVFGYVTRARAAELGVTNPQGALDAELAEYGAYCEGDVYGIVIERKVHAVTTHDGVVVNDDDEWVTEESVWGFYGYEYAESEARTMFDSYTRA